MRKSEEGIWNLEFGIWEYSIADWGLGISDCGLKKQLRKENIYHGTTRIFTEKICVLS